MLTKGRKEGRERPAGREKGKVKEEIWKSGKMSVKQIN